MKENNNKFNTIVQSAISNIDRWNKKVKKGEYTLETWINQFKNKPFRKLN